MRALRYFFDEALASLWRGFKTALIATATIAVAFVVLGGFLILTSNMERVFTRWQDAAEFSVYLADDGTAEQRAAIENALRESAVVARRRGRVEGRGASALQAEFRRAGRGGRRPHRESAAGVGRGAAARRTRIPTDVESLAAERRRSRRRRRCAVRPPMDSAADGRASTSCARAGFALAALLVFAAALTVASVVRLALVARREEIHIMQLVGAPIAYIRGPFIVEGLIQGGLGRDRGARSCCGSRFSSSEAAPTRGWPARSIRRRWYFFRSDRGRAARWRAWRSAPLGGFIAARSTRERSRTAAVRKFVVT